MKLCYIDTETTGLTPGVHSVHQISLIIEVHGEVVAEHDLKFQPHPSALVEPAAIAVSGLTREALCARPMTHQEGFRELKRILGEHVSPYDRKEKYWLVAYNAAFDAEHLRATWRVEKDKYFGSWFWTPALCAMVLAGVRLQEMRPFMPNFKQATVAAQLGVNVDNNQLHDALYDVRLCREIYQRVRRQEWSTTTSESEPTQMTLPGS